jgi:hypothetical protein
VALICLFLISQVYKHSSPSSSSARSSSEHLDELLPLANAIKIEKQKRPIVLPYVLEDEFEYSEPGNSFFKQKHNVRMLKIDWHDHEKIKMEKAKVGPGEQGKAFKLTKPEDIEINNQLLRVNGYYARASDIISVNRSIADIRHPL